MKKITLSLIAIFFILSANSVSASHVSGGDITYTCIGTNQYEITLKLYRDCSGVGMSTTASVSFTNTCGLSNPNNVSLTLRDPNNLSNTCTSVATCNTEVSQLCTSQAGNSSCNGGSLPGMQEYIYKGVVTLSGPCNSWTIAYNLCCRNTTVNVSGQPSYHVETTMNSANDPCNNSAIFTAQPIPYICVNNPVSYNLGAIDPDGDSLYYTLISAKSNATTNVTYNVGYSGAVPIPGITINNITGQINFTPTLIGNFIVVVQVEEFDFFGASLGTVARDFQFVVQSCSNTPPNPSGGVITNFSGTATQTGPYSIEMCVGENFSFDAVFSDPNPGDSLSMTTNITSVLAGSSFSSSGSNPLAASFSWTAPAGSGATLSFVVTINDGACPVPGINSFTYTVTIGAGVFAGPDQIICTGNTYQLQVFNATNPVWTSVAGDPIQVGTNISCDSCVNPVITPSQTTTYVVTSDSVGGLCNFTDTVTITVLNATGPSIPDAVICPGPGNFASINVGSGYTNYTWTPACCVGQFANIFNPGTYIVSVDTLVCTMTDTFVVSLAPNPSPTITGDIFFCKNENTTLGINGNYTSYTWSPNGETDSTITTGIGTYFATVIDTNGCTWNSDTVIVTNSNPQAFINNVDTVCPGNQTTISVSPSFNSYLWSNGETTQSVTVGAGNFDVIVTDNFGCIDTAYATVPNYPVPNAAFSINPDAQGQPGIPITFTDNSSGNIVAWLWSFGDGGTSSIQNPTHIYQSLGYFNVILVVENANGCRDTVSREYFVISELIIPNVFTPNGDGFNDLFVIENLEFFDNNLKIYNRWGTKVFEKENYKNNWDGNGVSDGTYFFILEVKLMDDSIETHKGTISILK